MTSEKDPDIKLSVAQKINNFKTPLKLVFCVKWLDLILVICGSLNDVQIRIKFHLYCLSKFHVA